MNSGQAPARSSGSFEQVSAGEYYQTLIMSSLNPNQAGVLKEMMMGFVVEIRELPMYRGG